MLQPVTFTLPNRLAAGGSIPRHLRLRREKIFGPAPSHRLDGNTKARIWAAAKAYNATHRQGRQHRGPLTWATLRVLRVLLWRFHSADAGGRCFPGYERIARAAECCRDSVNVAVKALEDAGLLTWVHRLTRIRRRERDLLGQWSSSWQVIRTSNGYVFHDPLDRESGRRVWCKSENPARPTEPRKTVEGPRPDGAGVTQEETPRQPPGAAEPPAIAPQREHAAPAGALLSPAARAAIEARMDKGIATRADREAWDRDLDARIAVAAN